MREAIRLSETDKAYFAGLVDSKATVNVRRSFQGSKIVRRELVLDLDGLEESQVDWIKARFKGSSARFRKNAQTYAVRFETRYAAAALTEALGYMIRMEAEARLVFKFASAVSKQGRRLTEDQERIRAEVDEQLGALKRGA